MTNKMIIDISHHQVPSKIDYRKLCSQLSMAIIRVQYGSKLIDRHYKTHIAGMKSFNVPFGVYAWVRGISERDMEVEATDFYNRSKDLDPAFYVLDVEEDSMTNMRAGINAYAKKLRSLTNKKIGVYIGHHLYKSFNLDLSKFDFIWIPRYGKNNGKVDKFPDFPCDIHQYTENGRLDGYPGNLDLNRLTGSKPLSFFTAEEKKEEVKEEINTNIPSNWAKEDWTWGAKNKITDGSNPKRTATREEVISMIRRSKEVK